MNAVDGIFNIVSGFLEKFTKIDAVYFPWEILTEKWNFIAPYIRQANVFFPIESLLIIMSLVVSFLGIMMVLWGIKFMKDIIPFI